MEVSIDKEDNGPYSYIYAECVGQVSKDSSWSAVDTRQR